MGNCLAANDDRGSRRLNVEDSGEVPSWNRKEIGGTSKTNEIEFPSLKFNSGGSENDVPPSEPAKSSQSGLRVFFFDELREATGNFRKDSLLGEGGFGCVYRGVVEIGGGQERDVAVKVLNTEGLQGHREWMAEVNFLGLVHHKNLVHLIGYCSEKEQRLLVYEYMPRGSLETHLFRRQGKVLEWSTRIHIAIGAAQGLAYLHEGTKKIVIFRDFKASNILLDFDFTAKLSDFGLAKSGPEGDKTHVSTRVMGTYGYAAPEYIMTGHLTAKSDVYSFGVVLLELITGRRSMDKTRPPEEQNLVEWARQFYTDRRKLFRLMDPRLEGQYSIRGATKAALLAQHCLNRDPKARPLMSEVVETLKPIQNLIDSAASYAVTPEASVSSGEGGTKVKSSTPHENYYVPIRKENF